MTQPLQDNDKKPISSELTDATPLLNDPQALQAQAKQDGVLFFRGLLDRQAVLDVRKAILDILDEYDLLDRSRPLMEGSADPDQVHRYTAEEIAWNGVGVPLDIYHRVQKLESFHALAHSPALISLYTNLFGAEPFVHPRHIGRIMLPHKDQKPTPSHQDYLHIQGTEHTWTCWAPLGDVPRELGGLAMLKGSQQSGLLGVTAAPGAGGLESILCGLDYEWQTCEYQAGDVITFHSHTVHKSMPNQIPGRVRLSCDFRYQPAHEPIESASLLPHGPFAWDELYEGWTRSELMHYWNKMNFDYTTFDESIRWQKDKIC
ncbi:hypothetical protein SY83_02210 [Paenibacillus swuensis]|uniref:Phytanoyl-CoA dioxygenase n=1 Tax=Paenibacillus swuensis TaxID=1178515 RepID=A0A172TE73_9BACL|nr:phytanoyl-CoA dioxygenase family protein [Paenibacillus swuensis]ANE45341.1 hypothetical protein SY83_02210 [Paenibacillus swuensis]